VLKDRIAHVAKRCPSRGTEGSNPSPSSGESVANLTPTRLLRSTFALLCWPRNSCRNCNPLPGAFHVTSHKSRFRDGSPCINQDFWARPFRIRQGSPISSLRKARHERRRFLPVVRLSNGGGGKAGKPNLRGVCINQESRSQSSEYADDYARRQGPQS
jgi:hypothetical protein